MIDIQNSGTGTDGYDIIGTDDAWYVTSAGALTAASVVATSLTSATNLALNGTGAGTIVLAGTSTGAITLTTATTCGAALTVTTTLTVGTGATFSDGSVTITDNSNTAAALTITNNTQSTYGNTSDAGMVMFTSETITTGALLHLSLDETNLSTGSYIRCWGQDASAAVFSVKEYGATTIAGNAVGTTALGLTAGDIALTDGNVSITSTNTIGANVLDISSATTTTKHIIDASDADGLTTGYIANLKSNSSDTTARYLVYVENTNAAATGAIPLGLKNASTGTTMFIDHNGVTGKSLYIDAETTTETGGIIDIAPTVLTTGTVIDIGDVDAITQGVVLNIASTSATITSADFIKIDLTASSGTLTARTGSFLDLSSSLTNTKTSATLAHDYDMASITRVDVQNGAGGTTTSAGSVLKLLHTATQTAGTLTDSAVVLEVQATESAGGIHTGAVVFINNDATTAISLSIDAETTTANVVDISATTLTEGKGIDMSDLDAITTGKAIHIDATGTTQTSGILVHIDSASTALTGAGRLLRVDHTGNATAGATSMVAEFASAAADNTTIVGITASAALASGVMLDMSGVALTTGKVIDISDLDAITTGKVIHVDATGVTHTDGILVHLDSGSTAMTSTGRIFLADHTGNATVSGIIGEFKSAAADETTILKVTASAALAAGVALDISPAAMTTGTALDIGNADALTTGKIINAVSNSADSSTRSLVYVENTNTAATGTTPLSLKQTAPTSTNYYKITTFVTAAGTVTLWMGAGTTANGNLSGTAGDICFNGGSNKPEYCT